MSSYKNTARKQNKMRKVVAKQRLKAWRNANPEHYAFLTLKANARRRRKDFSLTLEEFKQFCYEYDYINKKGITVKGYGIDRIEESEGYQIWNIRLLLNGDNVRKYKVYDWEHRTAMTVTVIKEAV